MSCILSTPETVSTLADYIAACLNMSYEYSGCIDTDELNKALKDCIYAYRFNEQRIFDKLYTLNTAAYNGRYPKETPDAPEEVPSLYKPNRKHHAPVFNNGHFVPQTFHYEMAKRLDFFIYQCEEDATRNSELLKALMEFRNSLFQFIVHNSADYLNANWGD